MKVLLVKDVYKLGRAGDVKKVADGYGRNYLIPQGLAVLATAGAMKSIERIRNQAAVRRAEVNKEMSGLANLVKDVYVTFPAKAGETGKLYGSITPQMIAEALSKKIGATIERRYIEVAPIRTLGEFKAIVRLTVDLTPEIHIVVHREGEVPNVPAAEQPAEAATEA